MYYNEDMSWGSTERKPGLDWIIQGEFNIVGPPILIQGGLRYLAYGVILNLETGETKVHWTNAWR